MNVLFFYLLVFFCYLSITGYGLLFNNRYLRNNINNSNLNNLLNFTIGVILLSVVGFILYLFSVTNLVINLIIILSGVFFFYNETNKHNLKDIASNALILLLVFSGLIISKTHEDFIPYHFKFIEIITNSKVILGLGKLEINFIYTPLIAYLQKLFVLPLFDYKLLHVPIFLLYFSIINFLLKEFFFNKKINLLFIFILIFYLIKFTRISEYGYDYLTTFLSTIIFILFINELKNINLKINAFLYIIIFTFSLSIKNITIFFLPIFMFIIYSKIKNLSELKEEINKSIPLVLFSFFLIIIFIIEGFLKSGCIINFLIFTCTENKNVFWAVDKTDIIEIANHVKLWAKGYYHQEGTDILSKENYNEKLNWFNNWYNIHFHYKVIEFLALLSLIFFIIHILLFSKNTIVNKKKKIDKIFIIFSIVSILLWLLILPQLRFGAGLFIFFYLIILSRIIGINDRIFESKKILVYLLCLSILIFNIKNFNRINDELNRNDRYKFNNFPYVSITDYAKPKTFHERFKNKLEKKF